MSIYRCQVYLSQYSQILLNICKLIRLVELCNIYKIYFNQIFAFAYSFSNINMRVTTLQLGDILIDMTFNKVIGELTKSINNWH